jgi:hypothetical protein
MLATLMIEVYDASITNRSQPCCLPNTKPSQLYMREAEIGSQLVKVMYIQVIPSGCPKENTQSASK